MHTQLTLIDREYIGDQLKTNNTNFSQIGQRLGKSHTTISREIKKNSVLQIKHGYKEVLCYIPNVAHTFACNRRYHSKPKQYNIDILNEQIQSLLHKNWSLEQIHGSLSKVIPNFPSLSTLYDYVRAKLIPLPKKYVHKIKKRKQAKNKAPKQKVVNCKTIHEVTDKIQMKKEFGHWELDLIESATNDSDAGYIIVLVERVSRFVITRFVLKKESKLILKFLREMIKKFKILSIITDNGSEFHRLYKLKKSHNIEIYYTDPGAPYQKGLVEERNKQIRLYIKKKEKFTCLATRRINFYTNEINNKPLKVLNYNTPQDVLNCYN